MQTGKSHIKRMVIGERTYPHKCGNDWQVIFFSKSCELFMGLTQNNTGTLAITFPTGVFSLPVVVPSVDTGTPQSVVCSANNISVSGCNLNVRRSDTVSTATVHVIVMQYAP